MTMTDPERLAVLETEFQYVRRDLDEIRTDTRDIKVSLAALPSRADLRNWHLQTGTAALAIIAIFVGVLAIVQHH